MGVGLLARGTAGKMREGGELAPSGQGRLSGEGGRVRTLDHKLLRVGVSKGWPGSGSATQARKAGLPSPRGTAGFGVPEAAGWAGPDWAGVSGLAEERSAALRLPGRAPYLGARG